MGPKDPLLAAALCCTPVHFPKEINVNLLFWVFCCLEKEAMRKNWCRRAKQNDRPIVYGKRDVMQIIDKNIKAFEVGLFKAVDYLCWTVYRLNWFKSAYFKNGEF